jgi:hypothetical protein
MKIERFSFWPVPMMRIHWSKYINRRVKLLVSAADASLLIKIYK